MSSGLLHLRRGRGSPTLPCPPWAVQRVLGFGRILDVPCTLHIFWTNSYRAARHDEECLWARWWSTFPRVLQNHRQNNFPCEKSRQNLNAALKAVWRLSTGVVPQFLHFVHDLPFYSVGSLAQHFLQTGFHTAAWTAPGLIVIEIITRK